jgi:hypothetical protein
MLYFYMNSKGDLVELEFPIGTAPEQTNYDNDVYHRHRALDYSFQQFVLKGSGWPSQDTKRKEQMTQLNTEAGNRTKKTWGKPKRCLPNHKGKLTGSWEDAKKAAKTEE